MQQAGRSSSSYLRKLFFFNHGAGVVIGGIFPFFAYLLLGDVGYEAVEAPALSEVDADLDGADLLSTFFSVSFVLPSEEGPLPLREALALPFLLSVT